MANVGKAMEMARGMRHTLHNLEKLFLQILRHPDATPEQLAEANRMYRKAYENTRYIQGLVNELQRKRGYTQFRINIMGPNHDERQVLNWAVQRPVDKSVAGVP